MTICEAHGRLAQQCAAERGHPLSVAGNAALAYCSGMLEGCQSDVDLQAAVAHGRALVNSEVLSVAELRSAVQHVIAEVSEQVEAEFGDGEPQPLASDPWQSPASWN